jgi:2-polyprenyl-6-hydroxyphenyl methylase/3-demethylubiquinone-9 3-methyltransferase
MNAHADEIASGQRFAFGENWSRFLSVLDEQSIEQAKTSLRSMLKVQTLKGKSFLDIGSGSGLFSLAARLLGAQVHSFDYDPQSVACTAELKRRYFEGDADWHVEQGSALDAEYLERLGQFDVVYSWGVLHHTGNMWRALELVAPRVKPDGTLFIALYNDQGRSSVVWRRVKMIYNRAPRPFRIVILGVAFVRLWGPTALRDLLQGRPFATWREYQNRSRGMSPWRDVVDWVGGYPFEVAKPEQVFEFFHDRGFELEKLVTCAGGLGCNEFVFECMQQTKAQAATQS